MRWPVLIGAMLLAAGPAAASSPLVYKAPPPAQPVHLHSPARENDLFPRFLEWLNTQTYAAFDAMGRTPAGVLGQLY
jgi:hypothetical protein